MCYYLSMKTLSEESGLSETEDKSGDKQGVPALPLTDSELVERILAGDEKLLSGLLMETCEPCFAMLAKKFCILKLEPQEIASIACIRLLAHDMSALRYYKERFLGENSGASSAEGADAACSEAGLREFVCMLTERYLRKMLVRYKSEI